MTAPFHWAWARATSSKRSRPDFLIVGAQKAGTTSLCTYLFRHPQVSPARRKEVHFFDEPEYSKGQAWYLAHFPYPERGRLTGEASPYYLCHPHVPRRVHDFAPEVKLIVMLRNPADRALSHYHHQVRHGRESLSFEDALAAEESRLAGEFERMVEDETYYSYNYWAYSYLERGRYAQQIERWQQHFGNEQILFIKSEDFFQSPREVHLRVLHFLSLDSVPLDHYGKQNTGEYAAMKPETREAILRCFAADNERLTNLVGWEPSWS